jgi:hypothetical protein
MNTPTDDLMDEADVFEEALSAQFSARFGTDPL